MLWGDDSGNSFKERVLRALQESASGQLVAHLPDWYNSVVEDVLDYKTWSHLEKEALLLGIGPYDTGTVDVTNGSATVTGTTTVFPTTCANQIFVGPDGREYRILTRDSPTQVTLIGNYVGDSDTGASYTIYFPRISVPADFDPNRLEALVLQNTTGGEHRIYPISHDRQMDYGASLTRSTSSNPYRYTYREQALYLWPVQSEDISIECYYKRGITRFDSTTLDTYDLDDDWPSNLQEAILVGVIARGYLAMENFDQEAAFDKKFQGKMVLAGQKDSRGVSDPGALQMRRFDEYQRSPHLLPGSLPRRFPGT